MKLPNLTGLSVKDLEKLQERTARQMVLARRRERVATRLRIFGPPPERVPVCQWMMKDAIRAAGFTSYGAISAYQLKRAGGAGWCGIANRITHGTQKSLTWKQLYAFAAAVGVPYQEFILFN